MAKSKSKKNPFKASLSDSRSRALVIVFGVAAVVALVIGWSILQLSRPGNVSADSQVAASPNINSTPTATESPRMTDLLVTEDQAVADSARKTGETMMATLTSMAQTYTPTIPDPRTAPPAKPEPKPSPKPKPKPEPDLTPVEQTSAPAPRLSTATNTAATERAQNIRAAMANIVSAMSLSPGATYSYKAASELRKAVNNPVAAGTVINTVAAESNARDSDKTNVATSTDAPPQPPLIPAATVEYGVMDMMADSDVPGPFMAHIVSGEFRGARLIGEFQQSGDHLRMRFTKLTSPEFGTVSVNAVAVNPNNTGLGLATYVNHHYIQRFGGLFLGGFIEGMAEAVGQGDTTVVVSDGTVVQSKKDLSTDEELWAATGEAASAIGGEIKELADTEVTVRVAAGTPIGILFVADVEQPSK